MQTAKYFVKHVLFIFGMILFFSACTTPRSNEIPAAAKTESAAQLGVRYLLGRGVPQNDAKAFAYFSEAADNDDPFAQNELAYMYAAGKGTTRNYTKAFHYYHKAANHGLASAQYNLAIMYENGLGTAENKEQARKWLEKSAAHGFEPAKKMLKE